MGSTIKKIKTLCRKWELHESNKLCKSTKSLNFRNRMKKNYKIGNTLKSILFRKLETQKDYSVHEWETL
jgi:hypothetical protein